MSSIIKRKFISLIFCITIIFNLFNSISSLIQSNDLIVNDAFWKDIDGNFIYSQGGGIFKFGDTYYWYGVHYKGAETYAINPDKKNSDYRFVSITCYSSKDLINWKFENDVITPKTENWGEPNWVGRMGVAYCSSTKQYVLVTQYNDDVLFATSSTPTGNFEIKNIQEQIKNSITKGTGDQTIFVDEDGQAYLIFCSKDERANQYISKLRESDFLEAEPAVEVNKGEGREGNCMFKYKGKYYYCTSDLHGWNASHSYYMVSDNIFGPYSDWKIMEGSDKDFSHVTQTGFFYTIKGTKEETVLFCGDRWSDFAGNGIGYNQWFPLSIENNEVKFNSISEFHLNSDTGEWRVGEKNNWILNPSFEADRILQDTMAGWTNNGVGNSNIREGRTGNFCMKQYSESDYQGVISQNITLPNGIYTLKAYAKASNGINESYIYVKDFGGRIKKTSIKFSGENDWEEIVIEQIRVIRGKCEVGVFTNGKGGSWVKLDDFSLIQN